MTDEWSGEAGGIAILTLPSVKRFKLNRIEWIGNWIKVMCKEIQNLFYKKNIKYDDFLKIYIPALRLITTLPLLPGGVDCWRILFPLTSSLVGRICCWFLRRKEFDNRSWTKWNLFVCCLRQVCYFSRHKILIDEVLLNNVCWTSLKHFLISTLKHLTFYMILKENN